MKLISIVLLLTVLGAPAWAQSRVTLPQGTKVTVHARSEISGNVAKTGDTIDMLVTAPVKLNNVVLIAEDAPVRGTVTRAKHSSGFGRSGVLEISIDSVQAVDGSSVKLRATESNTGTSHTVLAVGLAVLVAPVALFLQGQEAKLESSQQFDVFVNEDKDIAVVGVPNQSTSDPAAGSPSPSAVANSNASDPRGASVVLDAAMCNEVTGDGVPLLVGQTFSPATKNVTFWFSVAPATEDRVFEVRWYRGDEVVDSSSVIVRSGKSAAWATMRSSTPSGFPAGEWHSVVLYNGQIMTSRPFVFSL